ncbi:MAG: Glycerate kinase [Lacunisphaera sp.]|nr:Glycerate kinase [Lacunisphaera sp.]MDB6166775.1 Glycerate kinase [Lacunisphaera sp.]
MRVLIAFDKFKDALTARQACEIAAAALRARHPDWSLELCPLTDGGEGFCETLTIAAHGQLDYVEVSAPRGGPIRAPIGYVKAALLAPAVCAQFNLPPTGTLAVIGLASASGLELLPAGRRDPWQTTSRGTGEQIRAAARSGASAILLGIGGSATNDLGLGALAALGLEFAETPVPAVWPKIKRLAGRVEVPPIFIACDVTNPLLGLHGATATFGPQKGLSPADVPRLEAEMACMARLLCEACHRPLSLAELPGTGAAGGISFGLMIAANAKLVPGFELVSAWLDLGARLAAADLVITGEGRFDATSLAGKGPGSLVREAQRLGKAAHIFAGSLGVPADGVHHAITPPGLPLTEALPRSAQLLAAAVARVF